MIKYFFSILFLFLVDRFTKVYLLKQPSLDNQGGFIDLHLNSNIAFSWPTPDFILYPVIIIILVALISVWLKNFKENTVVIWPLGLIIIGAISNLLDRLSYGAVVDFINVPFFTVFNLSDIYIFLGVVWILVKLIKFKQ